MFTIIFPLTEDTGTFVCFEYASAISFSITSDSSEISLSILAILCIPFFFKSVKNFLSFSATEESDTFFVFTPLLLKNLVILIKAFLDGVNNEIIVYIKTILSFMKKGPNDVSSDTGAEIVETTGYHFIYFLMRKSFPTHGLQDSIVEFYWIHSQSSFVLKTNYLFLRLKYIN